MCRVFGYFEADIDPATLPELAGALRHGGPDGAGWRHGPDWGLGATRLAVMDPAGGAQPYELDGITAVFNGEIYNHDLLREELRGFGYRFADRCDGSIIPALYHRYGPGFAERLDGMFAIAVVDARERPTLVLCTDDAGMKPLYTWGPASGGVCFASELPAMRAFPGFAAVPTPGGLDAYLTTKAPFGEDTVLAGVKAIAPGSTVVYGGGAPRRIDRSGPAPLAGAEDPAAYAALLRDALEREVGRLARADVPVSVICSGGLDSSLVTALMAAGRDGVDAFHIRYDGDWPFDEHRYAAEVAARSGARLHDVLLDPADIGARLPQVVARLGQPNADPITVSSLVLFEAIRDAGYKVTVSGDGADEAFGGYDRIRAALAAPDWIPGYVDALAAVPPALRHTLYSGDYRAFLSRNGTERDRLIDRLAAAGGSRWERVRGLEVGTRLDAYHLRRVDHLSMAAAVEVRVPFCQKSIRALAANLPGPLQPTGAAAKPALYAAAAPFLPHSVLGRPKQPFTLPIAAMTGRGTALGKHLREVLLSGDATAGGLLDATAVRRLVDSVEDRAAPDTALALWALAVYRLWLDSLAEGGPR
ncbi:asparagine synthase (glutamine-hydrolyzing) [Glycomyces tritici]|uniref:asparagine synthase (glutamine-hydrolyzing) n=1 Tax=Glycomyces tritici TaxID=2665176 RepID=A0ABT7YN93_9ACTN|nr:asparagine synthase (glutamine-hydrolyzing) [Glycomyces tritici]MDN3240114.1 asparagine synthase (glutamine-hydrolyzing) [Glycomyces tritici]